MDYMYDVEQKSMVVLTQNQAFPWTDEFYSHHYINVGLLLKYNRSELSPLNSTSKFKIFYNSDIDRGVILEEPPDIGKDIFQTIYYFDYTEQAISNGNVRQFRLRGPRFDQYKVKAIFSCTKFLYTLGRNGIFTMLQAHEVIPGDRSEQLLIEVINVNVAELVPRNISSVHTFDNMETFLLFYADDNTIVLMDVTNLIYV